jgi:hypothetical protein
MGRTVKPEFHNPRADQGIKMQYLQASTSARLRLFLLLIGVTLAVPVLAVTNIWGPAAYMANARAYHIASLLPSGKVLVAGGFDGTNYISGTELCDPITNTWSATASMATARIYPTATLLPSGKVLVAGGSGTSVNELPIAELFDPSANIWTSAASMASAALGCAVQHVSDDAGNINVR